MLRGELEMMRERRLVWKLIYRYGLTDAHAFCALTLLEINGLLSAVRFCWKVKKWALEHRVP